MDNINDSLEGLNKAVNRLMDDRAAALKRAEAAEAALLRWDAQAIGDALGLPIGADVPDRAVGAIKTLRERIQMAESERDRCCDDYQREAARAEKAEAEVARLKGLLDAYKRGPWVVTAQGVNHPAGDVVKPPEPYTPRVGDVVLFDCERAESAEASPRVVTSVELDGWWSCVHLNRRRDAVTCGPFRISGRIGEVRLHRPATPAERAAAGLAPAEAAVATEKPVEPEAPAQPQVLPEHLAWMEADAAWACSSWSTDFDAPENKKRHDEAILAARALRAAVARRDGGGK